MVKVSTPVDQKDLPNQVKELLTLREVARFNKDFARSDELRQQLADLGYVVNDLSAQEGKPGGYELLQLGDSDKKPARSYLVLFGSGENAPSSVDIYRQLFLTMDKRDLTIALITSPAGFQPNVEHVYQEIKDFLAASLPDFNLTVNIVFANNRDQANDPKVVSRIDDADIIFTGPGSPTYAINILTNSLLYSRIIERVKNGASLILASAATIAFSRYALPVYEIYKVGEPLHWQNGLDFYQELDKSMTVIPHFNNREGGEHLDTSHCYVGEQRFSQLKSLLPAAEPVLGIDEHTAYILDLATKKVTIKGKGSVKDL